MTKKIIIDAAHKEETRVAVLEDGLLQDFDREALSIKQLKGNVYLAKITRIEPSLQAAFLDYGGDRHGFLPFSDIHPDYYNIADSDKTKLSAVKCLAEVSVVKPVKKEIDETKTEGKKDDKYDIDLKDYETTDSKSERKSESKSEKKGSSKARVGSDNKVEDKIEDKVDDEIAGSVNNYTVDEEAGLSDERKSPVNERLKIQDVLKEGQFVVVQVLKEERGNKGVAMTTYLSLAGKYCVLMSNSPNKGGVSKKISNLRDRKILRNILNKLDISKTGSMIIRTAGVGKRPEEIEKDYNYLVRLWDSIKQTAIKAKSTTFIHAEDDVIRRVIRDVYNENIEQVIIEGKEAYGIVSNLVRILSGNKNTNVKLYTDKVPVFEQYRVEQQISELYNKKVSLPSGGSIVIDQTEALVAIDVNSGKATRESNVEQMAVATNIEAAREIARQLRLRDSAGLVVVDFIDMFDYKNRRAVERTLRDALQSDRARIQMAKLSMFGLLEMSRQRLGASFFESSTDPCSCCGGTGVIKSVEIVAISILRSIRHAATDRQTGAIHIYTSNDVAVYMLNYKREDIQIIENNYNVHVFIHNDATVPSNNFYVKKRKDLTEKEKKGLTLKKQEAKINISFDEGISKSVERESSRNENRNRKPYRSGRDNRDRENRNRNRNYQNRNKKDFKKNERPAKKTGILKGFKKLFKK